MGKLPFMKFFPSDYIKDTRCLSADEKGVWMDLICFSWDSPERGKLRGDYESFSRMTGVEIDPLKKIMSRLQQLGICEVVTNGHTDVTVMSRRILRDEKEREYARLRKRHEREKGNVTVQSRKCPPYISEVRSQKSEKDLTTSAETYSEKAKNSIQKLLNENREIWHEAYPAINLETETAKALSWLLSNPKNKKSDFKRFLNNWMLRAQDKAPRVGAVGKPLTLKEIVAREGL
jgi:hypothetical protein